jgi:ketosteroid isomerase-like protein
MDEWLDFWAEDAVIMPPGLPAVHVSQSGDLAYMIERNVTIVNDAEGNPVTTHGKVVTVWRKRADGSWQNVVDMWNEAPPPPD